MIPCCVVQVDVAWYLVDFKSDLAAFNGNLLVRDLCDGSACGLRVQAFAYRGLNLGALLRGSRAA